jgi:hypothetical protein
MERCRRAAAAAAGMVLAAAGSLAAQTVDYTGSLHFSSGKYIFSEPTHTWTLYNGLSARMDRFRVSLGVPLVYQNTWVMTYVGGTPLPTGGRDYEAIRERKGGGTVPMRPRRSGSGRMGAQTLLQTTTEGVDTVAGPGDYELRLADPLFSGGIDIYRGWGLLRAFELTAAVKPPLRTFDSGAGTGEWDYSAGAGLTFGAGRALLFIDASWWWYGDLPEMELLDGIAWGAGAGLPIGDRWSIMASAAGAERVIPTVDPYASMSLMGSRRFAEDVSLNAGIGVGFTEASPDVSMFIGWRFGLPVTPRQVFAAGR